MSDTLHVSTRKGLFTVTRKAKSWSIAKVDFLGDNVSLTLTDPRDGKTYRYFDRSWGNVLANLKKRFDSGPQDWTDWLAQLQKFREQQAAASAPAK